jgi:hypothetical protein
VERISDVARHHGEQIPIARRRNGDKRRVGFLSVSPPAQAHPILPPCSQWGFPGDFLLKQSNGDTVEFNAKRPSY